MTASEERKLDALRKELQGYHIEVRELLVRYDVCESNVDLMSADIYGQSGERNENPGLLNEVADLKRSRRTLVIGLRGVWILLTVTFAAAIAKFFNG